MEAKPRLLFLSQCLPHPPDSGVTNRTFNLLMQLRRMFHVDLLAFSRKNHQADSAIRARSRHALEERGINVLGAIPIGSERSALRLSWDHLRSLLSGRAYTYYQYASREFQDKLSTAIATHSYSMVHVDSLDLHGFIPTLPPVPVACTHHSVESELLRLRAGQVRSRAMAAYIRHQAKLVKAKERRFCPGFAANVMMSDLDADRLRSLAPETRTLTVPNGVDVNYMRPPTSEGTDLHARIAFLGPTYMFPNRDAVDFFLAEIWTAVRERLPRASLRLIGKSSLEDKRRFEQADGVESVGYAKDIRPHISESMCCVAPLRVGGGTRLKILDYWALGKAVVSTSIGCEGLEAVDGHNILIRDEPAAFAEAVLQVLTNRELRYRLGLNARRTAEDLYSWESIGGNMAEAYLRLVTETAQPPTVLTPTGT